MLPWAITPLTWSISLFAIDWGLRKMLQIAGAIKKPDDLAPYTVTFAVHGHLFMNLSAIYRLTQAAFLTDKNNIDFSICGRVLDEIGIVPGKKATFFNRLKNTVNYLKFILSSKSARAQLAHLADEFVVALADNPLDAFNTLDALRPTLNQVALLHYITSAHSGAMSSALIKTLQKKVNCIETCKTTLTTLLENIDDIESADILASLQQIAKTALADNANVATYDSWQLRNYLKADANETVKTAYQKFYEKHGHRAIREAELRNKGWADDEEAFAEYLKTVIASNNFETASKTPPDYKSIFKEAGFKRTKALMYLTAQAREGVKNREYSKSKLIKILNEFKKTYSHIAQMLVAEQKLPDEDLIFFLTHDEIATLIKGELTLVKKAISRRRILDFQSELRFNEVYVKKPEPLPLVIPKSAGNTFKGTPISRGLVSGVARVVKNLEDATKLEKGEIMVAVFTDIGWSPYYCLIAGLVTEIGSALSHGAVVAREYALPFVSNVTGATALIKTGERITIDGATGVVFINQA